MRGMGSTLNPPEPAGNRLGGLKPPGPALGEVAQWFAEEVQPHEPMLRAWLRGRFPTLHDLDDLIQESYARLLRARAAGHVRNARNYLFATARNAALDFFRHERLAPFDPIGEKADQCVLDTETDVAATVSRQQELQLLSDAMQALPSRCRQVFTLRKLYGLSHHEIAAQLGISERTVEAQIDKAMRRCAAFLRERGLP
jgi:RNA polymerase sigma factor (sigma-70 family)